MQPATRRYTALFNLERTACKRDRRRGQRCTVAPSGSRFRSISSCIIRRYRAGAGSMTA